MKILTLIVAVWFVAYVLVVALFDTCDSNWQRVAPAVQYLIKQTLPAAFVLCCVAAGVLAIIYGVREGWK